MALSKSDTLIICFRAVGELSVKSVHCWWGAAEPRNFNKNIKFPWAELILKSNLFRTPVIFLYHFKAVSPNSVSAFIHLGKLWLCWCISWAKLDVNVISMADEINFPVGHWPPSYHMSLHSTGFVST